MSKLYIGKQMRELLKIKCVSVLKPKPLPLIKIL